MKINKLIDFDLQKSVKYVLSVLIHMQMVIEIKINQKIVKNFWNKIFCVILQGFSLAPINKNLR